MYYKLKYYVDIVFYYYKGPNKFDSYYKLKYYVSFRELGITSFKIKRGCMLALWSTQIYDPPTPKIEPFSIEVKTTSSLPIQVKIKFKTKFMDNIN